MTRLGIGLRKPQVQVQLRASIALGHLRVHRACHLPPGPLINTYHLLPSNHHPSFFLSAKHDVEAEV